MDTLKSGELFSSGMISRTPESLRACSLSHRPLNIIAEFEDQRPMLFAASKGHHIIVPLGGDSTWNGGPIKQLSIPNREGQVQGLIESGLTKEEAEHYSKESGRDITVMKRLLNFPPSGMPWIKTHDLRELIPALLVGKWNELKEGDRKIVEQFAGEPYEDYISKLQKWLTASDNPIMKIGEIWRLKSPLDLWVQIGYKVALKDLNKIETALQSIFSNYQNSSLGESIFHFEPQKFSSEIKKGITQSLTLIGFYGDRHKMTIIVNAQSWVDNIISRFLSNATQDMWKTLDYALPIIAEASPISVLESLEETLENKPELILGMFHEEAGLLHSVSNHTGLLWALEALAWHPEYISQSTMILTKLAEIDPGGNLANRPINSLICIFRPWLVQTATQFEDRMAVLERIAKKFPDIVWKLAMTFNHEGPKSGPSTNRFKWRSLGLPSTPTSTPYQEIFDSEDRLLDMAFKIYDSDSSAEKYLDLIEVAFSQRRDKRDKVYTFLSDKAGLISESDKTKVWSKLREMIHHHRNLASARWALSEEELEAFLKLYHSLEPSNIWGKYFWVFEESHPPIIDPVAWEGVGEGNSMEVNDQKLEEIRVTALETILKEYPISNILNAMNEVEQPFYLGKLLAKYLNSDMASNIYDRIINENTSPLYEGYINAKFTKEGIDWFKSVLKYFRKKNATSSALAKYLLMYSQI